ncbi:MAG TPA: hypothetical protein VI958_03200 [Acidobacteriota bacterium]
MVTKQVGIRASKPGLSTAGLTMRVRKPNGDATTIRRKRVLKEPILMSVL